MLTLAVFARLTIIVIFLSRRDQNASIAVTKQAAGIAPRGA